MIKKKIISKTKKAKYFTLMLDSTPDVSREHQIEEILRYVPSMRIRMSKLKKFFLGFSSF